MKTTTFDVNTVEKALQIIQDARALISDPNNWVQGTMALDYGDYPVAADSAWAKKFDAVAALGRAAGVVSGMMGDALLSVVVHSDAYQLARITLSRFASKDEQEAQLGGAIAEYNDTHTHQEVLDLFDAAANHLKAIAGYIRHPA